MMLRRKKILVVTTSDRMAGAEKNIVDLLRSIDKSRYEFKLVVFKNEKNGELMKKVSDLGIEAESLLMASKWHFYKVFNLLKIIKRFDPDILESFLFFDNQVCRVFGRIMRVKYVISGQQNVESRMSKIRFFIDKLTVSLADAIISNTKAGKEFYEKNNYGFKKKIYVAQNGVDIHALEMLQADHSDRNNENVFGISSPKNIFRILAVGYFTEQKGMVFLIKALEILKNKGLIFKCFIIGQGVLEEELRREVRTRKLEDCVYFLGYVSGSFQYLKLFDLFVLSSLWEGLPNVILEAMASKLPIITTPVGGIPEVIKDGETGFLVEPGSFELLADKLEYFMSLNKNKVEQITEAALRLVQDDFSVVSFIQKYEECYDKCVI